MLTPDGLLGLAERLANVPAEIEQRAAIGRAYYAAAHCASAIAIAAGLFSDREPDLHRVPRQLAGLPGPHGWAAIAIDMRRLKEQREMADYDLEYAGNLAAEAAQAVALARELIARTEALPPPVSVR